MPRMYDGVSRKRSRRRAITCRNSRIGSRRTQILGNQTAGFVYVFQFLIFFFLFVTQTWKKERVVRRFNSDGYILAVHHGDPAHCWKKVENVLLKVVDQELGFSEIGIRNPEATKVNNLNFETIFVLTLLTIFSLGVLVHIREKDCRCSRRSEFIAGISYVVS